MLRCFAIYIISSLFYVSAETCRSSLIQFQGKKVRLTGSPRSPVIVVFGDQRKAGEVSIANRFRSQDYFVVEILASLPHKAKSRFDYHIYQDYSDFLEGLRKKLHIPLWEVFDASRDASWGVHYGIYHSYRLRRLWVRGGYLAKAPNETHQLSSLIHRLDEIPVVVVWQSERSRGTYSDAASLSYRLRNSEFLDLKSRKFDLLNH